MKENKMQNSVFLIQPYRTEYGVWVFTDEKVGLVDEPFVGIINQMIDNLVDHETKCILYFSENKLPETSVTLNLIESEPNGSYYSVEEFGDESVWLCPALFKYFKEAPKTFYVRIEKIK